MASDIRVPSNFHTAFVPAGVIGLLTPKGKGLFWESAVATTSISSAVAPAGMRPRQTLLDGTHDS